MFEEILEEGPNLVIRRLVLEPGESSSWHQDNCHRFTVLVSGDRLGSEYKDDGEIDAFDVQAGMTGWDEPQERWHRAVNLGEQTYHEVVSFFRDGEDIEPQPVELT